MTNQEVSTTPQAEGVLTGTANDKGLVQGPSRYSEEERDRLRALMNAGDASDADLDVLFEVAQRSQLNPFLKEIYLVGRNTKVGGYRGEPERWETKWTVQSSIDGLRKILFRVARQEGVAVQIGKATYYGEDEKPRPYWTKRMGDHPEAAEIEIHLGDSVGYGLATWDQFVQTVKGGGPNKMWRDMGPHMLAKCAKAQAIRDLVDQAAGIYTDDEMGQANNTNTVQAEAKRMDRPDEPQGSKLSRAKKPAEIEQQPVDAEVWSDEELNVVDAVRASVDIDDLRETYKAVASLGQAAKIREEIMARVAELEAQAPAPQEEQ